MTHGSLFSGIGGFDLGFERAGFKTVWQVEIDDYARRVLAKNFPDAERFTDIRECGRHNLKPVDVISGGFPCQDISNAGKRIGISGERSGLWSEMWRVICEVRPSFVVVENVSALLGRGMERVLGDLASSGYDAEWDCLPASAFGAPHIRQRVFIVAYSKCNALRNQSGWTEPRRSSSSIAGNNGAKRDVADATGALRNGRTGREQSVCGQSPLPARPSGCGESVADAVSAGLEEREQSELLGQCPPVERSGQGAGPSWWATEPDVGRVAHGVPHRVDRLKGLGNAVVPQIAEWIAERIKRLDG